MLPADLMEEIVSDEVLDQAYQWLCGRRKHYSWNNDVWTLRFRWAKEKTDLRQMLAKGNYRFEPANRIPNSPDEFVLWSSRDALVLKATEIVLTRHLAPLVPKTCYHLAGNGGAKAAVLDVVRQLPDNAFVFRSDVKSYYASIDHEILFNQLKQHIADPRVLDLLWQFLGHVIYDCGRYEDVRLGIPLGCPLSPLLGAIYLVPLDQQMAGSGLFYVRFMDDWVVLSPTRWKLRAAVRCVNRTLAELKIHQHPAKTFVGRVSRGFDFLGYHLSPAGIVGVAATAIQNCVERMSQLYEQGADAVRIGDYVRRWLRWANGGLAGKSVAVPCFSFPPELRVPFCAVSANENRRVTRVPSRAA